MLESVLKDDMLADFPFDFSGDESKVIIHQDSSTLILGRSGTGKTTCLVFKLLVRYAAASAATIERSPHQLLLTRSNELASRLRAYLQGLSRTLNATQDDQDQRPSFGECPERIQDFAENTFPLVCTWEQFLRLLSSTKRHLDANRPEEGRHWGESDDNGAGEAYRDFDEGGFEEEDVDEAANRRQAIRHPRPTHRPREDLAAQIVDFHTFELEYWPKLAGLLSEKHISVELVFAEILGVIKGSRQSMTTLRPLSEQEYLELSVRLAPNFSSEAERRSVWAVFHKYQALKLQRGETDGVDYVVGVIRKIQADAGFRSLVAATFDEVYVDEIQDLRCLDIELLLTLVNDGRAFHFAGDTAQTISQDSHFRFEDIKAMFYDHFAAAAQSTAQKGLAQPCLFTLPQNYRSHQGILGLAALVMEMLWNGFPDMVDKLPPEIGQNQGPLPVFFLGCEPGMLMPHDDRATDGSKHTLEFGAEQAILVRDHPTKALLQAQLKDAALVLTIIESKGMEFEDVILWDFFTASHCAAAWRSAGVLKSKPESADTRKHASMCMELKLFYVAVTRARVRLSFMETEKELAGQVAAIFTTEDESPLVEVVDSPDQNVIRDIVTSLGDNDDAGKWSQRGSEFVERQRYEMALLCFRRAKDSTGQKIAQAHLLEDNGRRQSASEGYKAAKSTFRLACDLFKELGRMEDTIRLLERLGDLAEAAMLCVERKDHGKAASFFEQAEKFEDASFHYLQAGNADRAAQMLRSGKHFDQLVKLLSQNREEMSDMAFKRQSRYCVYLLKQGQLKTNLRDQAIGLIRSASEKESLFIAYEMRDQLITLYKEQQSARKLFLLHFRAGELGKALTALPDETNLELFSGDFIEKVQRTIDYCGASVVFDPNLSPAGVRDALLHLPLPSLRTPLKRMGDWCALFSTSTDSKQCVPSDHGLVKDDLVERFTRIHALVFRDLVNIAKSMAEMPYDDLETLVSIARSLDPSAVPSDSLVLLLTGVLVLDRPAEQIVILPWSPLRPTKRALPRELPRLAAQWFLDKVTSALFAFDAKCKELWNLEWPRRCLNYLTSDTCYDYREGRCTRRHARLSQTDCETVVSNLVKINQIVCSALSLLFRGTMGEPFNGRIRGIRRSWLERLLDELTFVSSIQRSSQVIQRAQVALSAQPTSPEAGTEYTAIAWHLEDLLFHRMRKEWDARCYWGSLIEQLQLAELLGTQVQERFTRAVGYNLRDTPDAGAQKNGLRVLHSLWAEFANPNAGRFEAQLKEFCRGFLTVAFSQVATFHSFTSIFELLFAYLLLKICGSGSVLMPQSWIDLHLPHFARCVSMQYSGSQSPEMTLQYERCVTGLATAFADMLVRLNSSRYPEIASGLWLSMSTYPTRLIHQRNCELLAVVVQNLCCFGRSAHIQALCKKVSEVGLMKTMQLRPALTMKQAFKYKFLNAEHLEFSPAAPLNSVDKLFKSYHLYDGKDHLRLLKAGENRHPLEMKLRFLHVETVTLQSVVAKLPEPTRPTGSGVNKETGERVDVRYGFAARAIQRFWRRVAFPAIQKRRELSKTPIGSFMLQLQDFGRRQSVSPKLRELIASRGVDLHSLHGTRGKKAEELEKRGIDLMGKGRPSEHVDEVLESVSGVLDRIRDIKEILEGTASKVTTEGLKELLHRRDEERAECELGEISETLEKIGRDMSDAERVLKNVA